MTRVTSLRPTAYYLPVIGSNETSFEEMEKEMAKFYCLVAALAVFAPFAFATLNQAAQIVA